MLIFPFVVASLAMSAQPIVLRGVPVLQGLRIADIEFYAYTKTTAWRSVAFQIDELNQNGEFVLDGGMPFTKHTDDGFFDDNDELVLDPSSFGDCEPATALAPMVKHRAILKDRSNRSRACLFMHIGKHPQIKDEAPSAPLVSFDEVTQIISSANYEYRFQKDQPILLGELLLSDATSQTPLLSVIKSSRFYFHFSLPWYFPNFGLNRDNFVSQVESWGIGPLRTIVAVGVKFRKLLSLFNLHLFSELVFYSSALKVPTKFVLDVDPSKYLKKGTVFAYAIDFTDEVQVLGNVPPLPPKPSQLLWDEGVRAKGSYSMALTIKQRRLRLDVRIDPRLMEVSLPPYQWQGATHTELNQHHPWLTRVQGDLGIAVDTSALNRGSYDFGLDLFLDSEADEDLVKDFGSSTVIWSQ